MQTVRQGWRSAGLILLLAFAVRIMAAFVVQRTVDLEPGRICLIPGDAAGYWELAGNLLQGEYRIYDPPRQVMRMPGFPLLLAGCRLMFSDWLLGTRCLLALIGALACCGTYWLGRVLFTEEAGIVGGIGAALSPALVGFSPLLLSETAFGAALVAHGLALACLWQTPATSRQLWLAIVSGLLGALATYFRPTWLPVVPLVAVWHLLVAGRGRPARWAEAGAMVIALVFALQPWMVRNLLVTGHPVITTLWDGPSLYDGLHPGATGDSEMTFFEREQLLSTMTEYQMNQTYRQRAWQWAGENPGRVLELAVVKARRYWSFVPNAPQFQRLEIQTTLSVATVALFLLALVGAWVERGHGNALVLTTGALLFFAAVHLLFVSSLRYRLPAEYPLWALAGAGWVAIRRCCFTKGAA